MISWWRGGGGSGRGGHHFTAGTLQFSCIEAAPTIRLSSSLRQRSEHLEKMARLGLVELIGNIFLSTWL